MKTQTRRAIWMSVAIFGVIVGSQYVGALRRNVQAREALEVVEGMLEMPIADTTEVNLGTLFRTILGAPVGPELLQQLDADRDRVAFNEARMAVFYVHKRDHLGDQSCLGHVLFDEGGSSQVGHAGFPDFIKLESLGLDEEALTIRYSFSAEPEERQLVERRGGTLGELRTAVISLNKKGRQTFTYSDLGLPGPFS